MGGAKDSFGNHFARDAQNRKEMYFEAPVQNKQKQKIRYSYSRSEATEEVLSRGYLEVCMYVYLSVRNIVTVTFKCCNTVFRHTQHPRQAYNEPGCF